MTAEQYTKQVAKHLCCTNARKREIVKQLQSDIQTAAEAGGNIDEVLREIGTPEEQAAEFNENFDEAERKRAKRAKNGRIAAIAAALVVLFIGVVYWVFPKQTAIEESRYFTEDKLKEQTEELIGFFNEKDYDMFFASMTEKMRDNVTKDMLEEGRRMIAEDFGGVQAYGNYYMVQVRQANMITALVQVNVAYEKVSVTYTITFDTDGKVAGFYLR